MEEGAVESNHVAQIVVGDELFHVEPYVAREVGVFFGFFLNQHLYTAASLNNCKGVWV
jgi:hypothetical protein